MRMFVESASLQHWVIVVLSLCLSKLCSKAMNMKYFDNHKSFFSSLFVFLSFFFVVLHARRYIKRIFHFFNQIHSSGRKSQTTHR